MIEKVHIVKPKTRPVQIEPWLVKYLTHQELKVIYAILAHADYKNRQDNSFPSNKQIAFYANFTTKDAVKPIKRALIKKGVMTKTLKGKKGKETAWYQVDLDWSKERYLQEFDEYFEVDKPKKENKTKTVKDDLEELTKLANDGNISADALASKLEALATNLKTKEKKEADHQDHHPIPPQDIEKIANFYVMKKDDVLDKDKYKSTIKKRIKDKQFHNVNKIYDELISQETNEIFNILNDSILNDNPTLQHDDTKLNFTKVEMDHYSNIFLASYYDESFTKDKSITIDKQYIMKNINLQNYTTYTKSFFENYDQRNQEYLNKSSPNEIKKE